jgi:hypothetical protein
MTIGISVVPGFAKHTSTPACKAVSTRLNAPVFTKFSPQVGGYDRELVPVACATNLPAWISAPNIGPWLQ